MKEETRRAVAYIAASIINNNYTTSIYSYGMRQHTSMSGNAGRVYDYGIGKYIADSSYYHYGNSAHLQITINGSAIAGYDYDSGYHFSGAVNNLNISLYDNDPFQKGRTDGLNRYWVRSQ